MNAIRKWLHETLSPLAGSSGQSAAEVCLTLSDQLETMAQRAGCMITKDLWIASRFEEAELEIEIDGKSERIAFCFVPMRWTTEEI